MKSLGGMRVRNKILLREKSFGVYTSNPGLKLALELFLCQSDKNAEIASESESIIYSGLVNFQRFYPIVFMFARKEK